MRIRQSFCYPNYLAEGQSLDHLFGAAADMGYAATELWARPENFDEVVETARGHGLAIASMGGHDSLPDGLNRYENHDRIEAELKTSIEIAADLGIPGLICFSGNRQPHVDELQAIEATAVGIGRVAAHAEKYGINLNIELLNSKVNHPGYQCDHTAWGVAVCEKVGSERIKLLYDIYHMQIMEGDVIRTIADNIKWIGHFHTAGNPGRADLDADQELNYAGICRAIAGLPYYLYVGHEYRPKADAIASLSAAFAICDQS